MVEAGPANEFCSGETAAIALARVRVNALSKLGSTFEPTPLLATRAAAHLWKVEGEHARGRQCNRRS